MKRCSLLLVLLFGMIGTTPAQKTASSPDPGAQSPDAAKGPALLDHRLNGAGKCRVRFDANGEVASIVITKSTGSATLDAATVTAARRNWHGLPNSTTSVPVKYFDVPLLAETGAPLQYETPVPPYPAAARMNRLQGTGIVQVIFNVQGKPVYAGLIKSFNSKSLDDDTISYIMSHWKSSGGEDSMITIPVKYVLKPVAAPTDVDTAAADKFLHRTSSPF